MTGGMTEHGMTDGRNEGQPKSSISPFFQTGAIKKYKYEKRA